MTLHEQAETQNMSWLPSTTRKSSLRSPDRTRQRMQTNHSGRLEDQLLTSGTAIVESYHKASPSSIASQPHGGPRGADAVAGLFCLLDTSSSHSELRLDCLRPLTDDWLELELLQPLLDAGDRSVWTFSCKMLTVPVNCCKISFGI